MSETKDIVEALIMASEDPLSVDRICKILNANNHLIETKELRGVVNELIDDYSARALELKEVASGLRFQVKAELSYWISKLHEERPPRYSKALLETLSLIAYRQPITRSEIEDVRGVAVSSNIVKTLLDHEWVKVVGHKEVPGRPALLATTKKFLDHFNLKHLNELPPLAEFTEEVVEEIVEEVEEVEGDGSDNEIEVESISSDEGILEGEVIVSSLQVSSGLSPEALVRGEDLESLDDAELVQENFNEDIDVIIEQDPEVEFVVVDDDEESVCHREE